MGAINLVTEVPGPRSREIVARREAAMTRGIGKLTPIAVERAKGALVTDVDGNTYIDFAGGIGMFAVGHNYPPLVDAIKHQVDQLVHMCAIVGSYEPLVIVSELLNEITPGDHAKKTALLNSGAEAVEAAVKIARAHTKRQGIIVFEGAYHGRTNMTMSMTSKYKLFKSGFGPFAPEVYRLPFPNPYRRPEGMGEAEFINWSLWNLEHAMVAQIDPEAIAAIVIEPVQGEGGFIATPAPFLNRIRELCDQHGIVMIADEIQCGFGRTGKLFASEHYDLVPDLITTGKSMAGGTPLAAVTGRADIMDAPHPGGLGGTYSGSPLACVAAIESISAIRQPEFLARANKVGERIRAACEGLQASYDVIGDVRGLGAMIAVEYVTDRTSKTPNAAMVQALTAETLQRGLITIRAGLYSNCVRFLPPLNISDDLLDEGLAVFESSVHAVAVQAMPQAGD
jgi:4-aminobutyrate aminotransferase / (S)-3-amino-2-methylpropionate transaminase / 5-aminovalerate transaminase